MKEINADNLGGFKLYFSKSYSLELFPDDSDESEESEFWRFFQVNNLDSHVIVGNNGMER
ncbi:MAG: hypothetical protein ACE3JK_14375 [Sporolactobacillus sp.]